MWKPVPGAIAVYGDSVSSASIRQSNLEIKQRELRNSSDYRDYNVAQVDEIREHAPHMLVEKKKLKKVKKVKKK